MRPDLGDMNAFINIIYDSEHFCVLEYPQNAGYEVVNKHTRNATYFQGEIADRFRVSMLEAAGGEDASESIEELLSDFGGAVQFPVRLH